MKNRFRNNMKIKLISLLSALVLWLYVMTIEDPVETRTFSDIPVRITNMSILDDRGLTIYPEKKLLADIYIKANLSSLRPINRNNIYIYGRIDDPKEGKNVVYLQANLPERVNKYEIKPNVITLDLENITSKNKNIRIDVEGKFKTDIDNIKVSKKNLDVKGPESLVKKVEVVKGVLDVSDKNNDFSTKVKLIPIDKNGDEVKGVNLENKFVDVSIKFLKEKLVPIKLNFNKNELKQEVLGKYSITPKEIVIQGKKETLDKINEINTQPINEINLKGNIVLLDLPKNVKSNISNIKLTINKNITSEFLISKFDVELINKDPNVEELIKSSKVPDNIKLTVTYSDDVKDLTPKDIKLYIDFDADSRENGKFNIKYKSNYDLKDVKIEPKTIEI